MNGKWVRNRSLRWISLSFLLVFMLSCCGVSEGNKGRNSETVSANEFDIQSSKVFYESEEYDSEETNTIVNKELETLKEESGQEQLKVHYIDVGQGDCTLITCGDKSMLIDAGPDGAGTKVQYYLLDHDIHKLDYVIMTHPDADHIGGMDVVLTKFDCSTVMMVNDENDTDAYRDVLSALEFKSYKTIEPVSKSKYELGDACFTIIRSDDDESSDNDKSIICYLEYGNTSFLFPGDAENIGEKAIIESGIKADVYKAGHHGSKTSSSDELLDSVRPSYAVISCGAENSYGHPHEETLERLKSRSINTFRTDEQSNIIAVSDGTEIRWSTAPSTTWAPGVPKVVATVTETETPKYEQPIEDVPAVPSNFSESRTDDYTYVLNTNSKKFHLPSCDSVRDMKAKNRKDVKWIRDAVIEAGYQPCKRCNP